MNKRVFEDLEQSKQTIKLSFMNTFFWNGLDYIHINFVR